MSDRPYDAGGVLPSGVTLTNVTMGPVPMYSADQAALLRRLGRDPGALQVPSFADALAEPGHGRIGATAEADAVIERIYHGDPPDEDEGDR